MYEYNSVLIDCYCEIVEKKSRFISHVAPVSYVVEAIDFIYSVKKALDATHNVYAYVLKDNNIQRYSDDGEPTGTAGMPTLSVIQKEDLLNICVVTTRYFGGTLLGAGGLVRAYTKAAKSGIDKAEYCERYFALNIKYIRLFTAWKDTKHRGEAGCIPGGIHYSDDVHMQYFVPYNIRTLRIKSVTSRSAALLSQGKMKGDLLMPSDIEIARSAKLKPITQIAGELGIEEEELELYSKYKAKLSDSLEKG